MSSEGSSGDGGGNCVNNGSCGASKSEIGRYLQERVEKKEEQILKIEASVFQVANYNFVFQGVILTAIVKGSSASSSTSASLKCQYFLLPLCLSAIGAALNFGTLLMIAVKYKESLDELDDRNRALYQHLYPEQKSKAMLKKHRGKKAWRLRILVLSMLLFTSFVALNLFAAWTIPCSSH